MIGFIRVRYNRENTYSWGGRVELRYAMIMMIRSSIYTYPTKLR